MSANRTQPSPLIDALHKLNEVPAIAICKDTPVAMPTTRFVADHLLATHVVRSTGGFAFVPDESIFQTYAILRSANEAWQHDKLPALAVCAFSKSPRPLQKETGIQADTVDQFLSDIKFAQRMVPKLGASPAYIIRHHHSTNDQFDDVILPAHANVVVYQPQAIDPKQLTALFEYVASVHGKIILCDDRQALVNSHPELTDALDRSLAHAIPRGLRKDLGQDQRPADGQKPDTNLKTPASTYSSPNLNSHSIPPHLDQKYPSDTTPTRSYLIYHARTENPAEFPNGYVLVAKVQAESVHRALSHSQNFGAPWTENPGVVAFTHEPRSTQPGDIICHNGTPLCLGTTDFEAFKCIAPAKHRSQQPEPTPDIPQPETPKLKPPGPKFEF